MTTKYKKVVVSLQKIYFNLTKKDIKKKKSNIIIYNVAIEKRFIYSFKPYNNIMR